MQPELITPNTILGDVTAMEWTPTEHTTNRKTPTGLTVADTTHKEYTKKNTTIRATPVVTRFSFKLQKQCGFLITKKQALRNLLSHLKKANRYSATFFVFPRFAGFSATASFFG